MAENPLLPHAELKALYLLLRRASNQRNTPAPPTASQAPRKLKLPGLGFPALLSGTLLQLRSGDVLMPAPGDRECGRLMSREGGPKQLFQQASILSITNMSSAALLACGTAAALGKAGQSGIVLAFCPSESIQPHWQTALEWAQKELLPLVLVCADPSGTEALRPSAAGDNPDMLHWQSLQKTTGRLKLPVLTVDGEDAVAIYRVMQESALRARSGGGPAVLWAALPQARSTRKGRSVEPTSLSRLEHFLRTRQIAIPSSKA